MYYGTCDMATYMVSLCDDEMLWCYSAARFEKSFMHVFDEFEDVAFKLFK